jgi:hypothetical protein
MFSNKIAIFCLKLAKNAQNNDQTIGPWSSEYHFHAIKFRHAANF